MSFFSLPDFLKRWVAFGSGVGLQISGPRGAESLHITAVKVRPNGARITGGFTIEDFPHQPSGVWGTDYAAFLKKLHLSQTPATVLLPRQDVIVRLVSLPGVSDKDLAAAIEFQLDGLHPYNEQDVVTSWSRLGQSPDLLVAIARREVIERYTTLFAEAGIRLRSFTCSAAAIYSALRMYGHMPPAELLAWYQPSGNDDQPGAVEVYGESASRSLYSTASHLEPERALSLASAELRFSGEVPAQSLEDLLGSATPLPFAAALISACSWLALPVNLLPEEYRQTASAWAWAPSAALAGAVVLLGAGLLLFPHYQDNRYLEQLAAEIAKVQPGALRANALEQQTADALKRTTFLDQFRKRSKADMDVLGELTRLLPPPAWLNLLEIGPRVINLAGEVEQAAPLLKTLDASGLFVGSEFAMPPMRLSENSKNPGEAFRIRTQREEVQP